MYYPIGPSHSSLLSTWPLFLLAAQTPKCLWDHPSTPSYSGSLRPSWRKRKSLVVRNMPSVSSAAAQGKSSSEPYQGRINTTLFRRKKTEILGPRQLLWFHFLHGLVTIYI